MVMDEVVEHDFDFAVLQSILARRPLEAQVGLLSTSLRSEIERRRNIQRENAELRKELELVKKTTGPNSIQEAKTTALLTGKENSEDDRESLRSALHGANLALRQADEDRTLLYATLMANLCPCADHPEGDSPWLPVTANAEQANGSEPRRFFQDREEAIFFVGHLLRSFGLDPYWSNQGLTVDPRTLRHGGGTLSPSDRVLLLAGHDLISEDPGLAFLDVVEHLRAEPLYALCSLVVALPTGKAALEQWSNDVLSRPVVVCG